MVEGVDGDEGNGEGAAVGVAGAGAVGVAEDLGVDLGVVGAAVSRMKMFHSLRRKWRCCELYSTIVFTMVSTALCVSVDLPSSPLPHHRIHCIAAASKN